MTESKKTVTITTAKVECSGDDASPHPRVSLTTEPNGFVDCPYCGTRFVRKASCGCSGCGCHDGH